MKIGTFMHQLFVMQNQLDCDTLSDVLKRPELAGLQCVDIDSRHLDVHSLKKIKSQLDDKGISVSSLYCDLRLDAIAARGRTALSDELEVHLERCADLNTNIFMPVPLFNGDLSRDDRQARILDFLHMAVERSPQYGVTMVLENFSALNSTIATIADMKFYLDRVPALQYVLDTGSYWFSDIDNALDACIALLDRTIHVHLKDILPVDVNPPKISKNNGRGYDHVATCEGAIPIREIIAELDKVGYDGALSIELITNDEPLGKTQRSIHNLQQLVH